MTAATSDRQTFALYIQREIATLLKQGAGQIVPAGVMVAWDATGFSVNASNTGGLVIAGRSAHKADSTASPADTDLIVEAGVFAWTPTAALIALGKAAIGTNVYVVDNQTIGVLSDATAGLVAGRLEQITDGRYYVATGLYRDQNASNIADATAGVATAAFLPTAELAIPITVPDAATQDLDYYLGRKVEIVDVEVIKIVNGAGNTIQVKCGPGNAQVAGTAISDAIAAAVDKAVTRAASIDATTPANMISAAGAVRLTATRAAGSMLARVILRVIPRA